MTNHLVRLQTDKFSVYVEPEQPFWFIPNQEADNYLQHGAVGSDDLPDRQPDSLAKMAQRSSLIKSITMAPVAPYGGRKERPLTKLKELWIHMTDNCNLSCKHCLFGCQPDGQAKSLNFADLKKWISESYELGTRLVVLTGGEPLVHPDFTALVKWCLSLPDLTVAVLTNGLLLPKRVPELMKLDRIRLHFQISLDGLEADHDAIRGPGSYHQAIAGLQAAQQEGFSTSVVMAVNQTNVADMPNMIEVIHSLAVSTVHFMWHFVRGSGQTMNLVASPTLITHLKAAAKLARSKNITIDNIEAIRAQLFSPVGTRYDLTNAGWESIAIGPDGCIYPTPALIGMQEFNAGPLDQGLASIWRTSPVLARIRSASLLDMPGIERHAWRLVLGGGDLDHAIYNRQPGQVLGLDPYLPLYESIIDMLLEEECHDLPESQGVGLILKMGDVSTDCPSGEAINFTHCNCLLSMGEGDHRSLISTFYAERAKKTDETILNPVHYAAAEIDFIPEEGRVRQYGCGSPVADAQLQPGQTLLDLGSGTGVEVFIAAKQVGKQGQAIGLDMTDSMLALANRSKIKVAEKLGYDNTRFVKGYLEAMPLSDNSIDVVISNCVINLTNNKRRVFKEIIRVLKPGGKLVISDVVTENEPKFSIRADQKMKGECLGGAYVQDYLFTVLSEIGFKHARVIKRFPYRQVEEHQFFSMTYEAVKPQANEQKREVIFAGPGQALVLDGQTPIYIGERKSVVLPDLSDQALADRGLFLVNPQDGSLTNNEAAASCCCLPPETSAAKRGDQQDEKDHDSGCLMCGADLQYLDTQQDLTCARCGTVKAANAQCEQGHFICDDCHRNRPMEAIKTFCLQATATDLIDLYRQFKATQPLSLHGPEYHMLLPGLITTAYRNSGGAIGNQEIRTAIERGQTIPGGTCGFMGLCGAAIGAGIAFAVIQKSSPTNGRQRQQAQQLVASLGLKLSEVQAARCCQREVITVLKQAAELSAQYLQVRLIAQGDFACEQYRDNKECIGPACPVPRKTKQDRAARLSGNETIHH